MPFVSMTERMMARMGRRMLLRRRLGATANFIEVSYMGVLHIYRPDELIGSVTQGDARVLLGAGPAMTPARGDLLQIGGRTWSVMGVTPRYAGEKATSYDCWVRGG